MTDRAANTIEFLDQTVFAVKTLLGWEMRVRSCAPADVEALLPEHLAGLERRILDHRLVRRGEEGRMASRIAQLSGWRYLGDGCWVAPEAQPALPGAPAEGNFSIELHSIGHGSIWLSIHSGDTHFDGGIDNIEDSLFDIVALTRAIRDGAYPQATLFHYSPLTITTGRIGGPPGVIGLQLQDHERNIVADIAISRVRLVEAWWGFLCRLSCDPLLGPMFLFHGGPDDTVTDALFDAAEEDWMSAVDSGLCDPDDRQAEMSFYAKRLRSLVFDEATEAYLADFRLMLRTLEIPERWRHAPPG